MTNAAFILSLDWFESHISFAFDSHSFSFADNGLFETEVFYKLPHRKETTIVGVCLHMTTKPQILFIEVWNETGFEHPMMRFFSIKHEVQFANESLPLGGFTGTVSILNYGNKSSVTLARELINGLLQGQILQSSYERNFALMARLYAAK